MRDLINTIFDFSKFEEAPIMLDATSTERKHLIDEYFAQEEAWRILELYEEANAWDDLAEGIKQYTIGGDHLIMAASRHHLAQARWKVRENTNLMQDIDDIIYDEWCKRDR